MIAVDQQAIAVAAALTLFTSIVPEPSQAWHGTGSFIHELAFALREVTNDPASATSSLRQPQQRTSDETRRIPLAFFGDSENVFGEFRARAVVVAVHINELSAPPRLIHRLAQHSKRLRVKPLGALIKADH
jgi:hypothetical protein